MADVPVDLCGYRVRNVSYKTALIIPDTKEGIEICFSIRRMNGSANGHQPWYTFSTRSFDPENSLWIEHTTGIIQAETETSTESINDSLRQ